jgi:hypothetical protein
MSRQGRSGILFAIDWRRNGRRTKKFIQGFGGETCWKAGKEIDKRP